MSARRFQVGERVVEGSARNCRVLSSAPGRHVVVTEGGVVSLRTARSPDGGTWVSWRGRTRRVRPLTDDAPAGPAPSQGLPAGAVSPATPAVVVRVLVGAGDRVARGQPVVVVSAMKMEMTLAAPRGGVVREVRALVGARVRPGDVLLLVGDDPGPGRGREEGGPLDRGGSDGTG